MNFRNGNGIGEPQPVQFPRSFINVRAWAAVDVGSSVSMSPK
ncbi:MULTISPECIES: hypothetical protein [Rhodococcus]|nr:MULTISPECIES: hypothetical protein [Rhodococcus]